MEFSEAWDDTCSSIGLLARKGSFHKLQQLVRDGAPVDAADNRGWRPLHEAAVVPEELECLKELLKHDSTDVNWRTHEGETSLLLACKRRTGITAHQAVILLLQNLADPNIHDNEEETPLLAATKVGNLSVVECLLKGSADPNKADCSGWTPLHEAAMHGKLEILKCLLRADAKIDVQDECRMTPLFSAAQHGQESCLLELLNAARDRSQDSVVDMGAEDFATPLMIAAQGFTNCVRLLLAHGANPNLKTTDNTTALHLAVQTNSVDCLKLLIERMCLQPLIDACHPHKQNLPSSTSSGDDHDVCPLHLAVEWESYECLQILLDCKFSPNSVYERPTLPLDFYLPQCIVTHESAFSFAVYKRNKKAMLLLMNAGATVNPPTEYSLHPLIRALCQTCEKTFTFLMDLGSNVNYCRPQFHNNEILLAALVMQYHLDQLLLFGCDPMLCFQDSESINMFAIAVVKNSNQISLVRHCQLLLQFVAVSGNVQRAYDAVALKAREDSKYDEKLWVDIVRTLDQPSSLKHSCRIAVRQCMCSIHYSRFVKFVKCLPLPPTLQQYVLFNSE